MLESRHLVGLFLGVVLLCGVFFTLGYVMGKTQYGTPQVADAASPGVAVARAASRNERPLLPTRQRANPAGAEPGLGLRREG